MAQPKPETAELVARWSALVSRYKSASENSTKCSVLKEILKEIDFHRKIGKVSVECHKKLRGKYEKEYKKLLSEVAKNVVCGDDTNSGSEMHSSEVVSCGKEANSIPSTMDNQRNFDNGKDLNCQVNSSSSDTFSANTPSSDTVRISNSTESDVVIEKVQELPKKALADGNILACWNIAKKKDNPLIARPEKRKYVSESPQSNKTSKSESDEKPSDFLTAREQLQINNLKRTNGRHVTYQQRESKEEEYKETPVYGKGQKSLGARRGLSRQFVPPVPGSNPSGGNQCSKPSKEEDQYSDPIFHDERLKHCEPRMIELILNEIMDNGPKMSWDDIAGLEFAKKTIQEIVVWPMLRPDIFTGLRGPPKGLLLFGPPGNGKTIIGKCIASQSNSTFFTISASSLTSKWVGEGEKMVRTLFSVARCHQPAVVFIDEIDSLLTQRSDQEHESSRRIKTEFLVQLDGACTASDERLLVIGATNRPQEIDEAARRRFVKRLYIPLPDAKARSQIVRNLLTGQKSELSDGEFDTIGSSTEGYSGADMANLCREAALGPIRCIPFDQIHNIAAEDVRAIQYRDFVDALEHVKSSVSEEDLDVYIEWNSKFGSGKW